MGAPSTIRRAMGGAPRPVPTPQAAQLLFVIGQLMKYGDTDTIANMIDYGTLRLQCLSARDTPR